MTNSSQADTDLSDPSSQVATISSLKVFKLEAPSTDTNNGGKRRRLLASVSSQQSRLTRVSNAVKVDGLLETGRATLQLEFTKQVDCLAEFVCQVRGVDTEGRELVSTSHILQQPGGSNDQRVRLSQTPGSVMQVLSLVQQLDAKLAVVGSAVGIWEDEMRRLKDTIQDDVESLKIDLDTKTNRLEDKIQSLGKDVDAQADRLEDKIESLQKDVNTKATRLEDKVATLNTRLEDKLDSVAQRLKEEEVGQSGPCQNGPSDNIDRQIKTEVISLDVKISSLKDDLVRFATDVDANFSKIDRQLLELEKINKQVSNVTQSPFSGTCAGSKDLKSLVTGGLESLEHTLQEKFHEMSLNLNTTASETRSMLEAKSAQGNLTVGANLKSTLTDLFKPKDCYKGMGPRASLTSSPYTVIEPSQGNSLVAPVLCDTFTDGGGWFVFQRRVTGDVNFYRGWKDYKQGFGSLDGDFWLGLDNIHAITNTGVFELRIDMIYNGNFAFAHYDSFSVGDEESNYILQVGHYDGTAGESFIAKHNGMPFSTHDRDNDQYGQNCAVLYVGAWWYNSCHVSNLNGQWGAGGNRGPRWNTLSGTNAVSYSEMKARRIIS